MSTSPDTPTPAPSGVIEIPADIIAANDRAQQEREGRRREEIAAGLAEAAAFAERFNASRPEGISAIPTPVKGDEFGWTEELTASTVRSGQGIPYGPVSRIGRD